MKSTYGTGCFALVNTGGVAARSHNRLIATAGYRAKGETAYAIEGSIFIAGAVVQWLRDALGVIRSAGEVEALARTAKEAAGLYFIRPSPDSVHPIGTPTRAAPLSASRATPALPRSRGPRSTRSATRRATCSKPCAATCRRPGSARRAPLKVDGGMVRNDWFCQRLADLTGLPVERPQNPETTALGAAYLAGLASGLFANLDDIAAAWALERRFEPEMSAATRDGLYEGWAKAVKRVR